MANMQMLATDENNPEFQGARDPDSLLHVRFYERALQNNFRSEQEGRPIFDTVVFIEIHTPGNQLNIIDRPKNRHDELRFPKQWAYYVNTHSDDPAKQGTPLSQWPLLDVAKVEMLRAQKFFTVEQIAYASDEQIMHLGMLVGMSPLTFRDKAKAYLEVARDASAVSKRETELKAAEERIAKMETEHKQEIAELNAKLSAVLEKMTQTPAKAKRYTMTPEHKAKLKAAREAAQEKREGAQG